MRRNSKYLDVLIVIIIILAMVLGANSFAVSKSTGDVQVTRTIGNGSAPAQYQKGDNFVVTLDYHVTPTQYVVSIVEHLPNGWVITNSSVPCKPQSNNNYSWNISSPLTGVVDGKIYYVVHIDDNAPTGDYQIDGGSGWFSKYADVKSGLPTDTAESPSTDISVVDSATNGPFIWISNITEFSGDGDGHLEANETAQFNYYISSPNGIGSYDVSVDGQSPKSDTHEGDIGDNIIYGTTTAIITSNSDPNNLLHTFKVQAWDSNSVGNNLSIYVYIPNYDYTAWMSGEWNGFTVQSAAHEPGPGNAIDSGWITLEGGNPIKVPAVNIFYYEQPKNINKEVTGSLSNIPFYSLIGLGGISGEASATINATPHDVSTPYKTYPIYTEQDTGAQSLNGITATFNGSNEMYGKNFHVMLLNLSAISGQFDLTNMSSIIDGLKSMTPEDIANSEIGSADKVANLGSCDFTINSTNIPALQGLHAGTYALVVMDYGVPNTPCLVSAAPIIVTKNDLETTQVGPMTMPGESVTLNENLLGTADSQYVYMAMMVPENNYSANITIIGDGSLNGTTLNFDGLSLKEYVNVVSDGTEAGTTMTITGMNGTYTLDSSNWKDSTKLKNILMSEINDSNMSLTVSGTTSSVSPDITLFTRPTMPTGNYTVLSVVLDRNTGNIAAVNQTTIQLGATYTYNLVEGWNLVDVPLNVTDNSIEGFFPASVRGEIVDLWGWNASTQTWNYWSSDLASPYWNFNNTTNMEAGKAYWLNMNSSQSFTIEGSVPASAPNAPDPIVPNWNMVGVTGLNPSTPLAMYPMGLDVWKWMPLQQNWEYWSYDLNSPYWTFTRMTIIQPGEGVYVNV